jgi:hypothetical protein
MYFNVKFLCFNVYMLCISRSNKIFTESKFTVQQWGQEKNIFSPKQGYPRKS